MILTHFLAVLGQSSLSINPAAAFLALASSEPLVGGNQRNLALVPAIRVRTARPILAVREG